MERVKWKSRRIDNNNKKNEYRVVTRKGIVSVKELSNIFQNYFLYMLLDYFFALVKFN